LGEKGQEKMAEQTVSRFWMKWIWLRLQLMDW
jgi:hypothetical protein